MTRRSSSFFRVHVTALLVLLVLSSVHAQLPTSASPSRWLYPRGNSEGTQSQFIGSAPQIPDSLTLKWSSTAIAGDVQPLIGNLIDNAKLLPTNPFAPLEITAVIAGQLVTLDATGRTKGLTRLPPFVRAVSVIMDSASLPLELYRRYPSILGLETIERRDTTDSLAMGYIAGYDATADSIAILKHLTIDVREFAPNLFASVKPVFGRAFGSELVVHSIVNMSSPTLPQIPTSTPFFRGMTSFLSGAFSRTALITVSDTVAARFTVGPSVSFGQPSISDLGSGRYDCVLPCLPTPLDWNIPDSYRPALNTYANRPYLFGAVLNSPMASEGIVPVDLLPLTSLGQSSSRPRIESFYCKLTDANTGVTTPMVLVAEEYRGRDSSDGNARLHLYNTIGDPITAPLDPTSPSFQGKRNHSWAVAVGDVDGLDTNFLLPYYPHNPGNEIVVSQSTHEFAFPASKLMVLRYRSGTRIQKPAPRNAYLFAFDTVVTASMTGWVACVSDLDNNGDGKSEIFIADGSELYVLRMRDYSDPRFTQNDAFDTVFTRSFPTENINHVAVADVDGDGYNDILVTTNVRTYLFGLPAQNSVFILDPARSSSVMTSVCQGDTAQLTWYNVFRGQPAVKVSFQPYTNGNPIGAQRVIAASVTNNTDTVRYSFVPDSTLRGLTGRYVIESTTRSSVRDSSAFVHFAVSFVRFDSLTKIRRFTANSIGIVTGTVHCMDSLDLFGSLDSGRTWSRLKSMFRLSSDTTFWFDAPMPCPTFFGCVADQDSMIRLRVEGRSSGDKNILSSDTIAVRIQPATMFTRIYPEPTTLCSERSMIWFVPGDSTVCDSVELLVSYDLGKTFSPLTTQAKSQNEYTYRPPVNSPDSVIFRICCAGTCLRTDTMLFNARARLIRKVAPNPFEPGLDICEIFSVPPTNTTATLRIFDQNEHVVVELVNSESRTAGRVYCDHWDGKTDDGKFATMGMYYAVIEYAEGSREFYPLFVKKK